MRCGTDGRTDGWTDGRTEWNQYTPPTTLLYNDRGHSGSGEAWGGAILLLPWGLFILMWRLWTHYYHKTLCCKGQIPRAPACPHLPLIPHHLQWMSLQFVCQQCHDPCKRNLAPTSFDLHPLQYNNCSELWFAGCVVSSPRTKSARRISWRVCSLMIWQRYSAPINSDGTAM